MINNNVRIPAIVYDQIRSCAESIVRSNYVTPTGGNISVKFKYDDKEYIAITDTSQSILSGKLSCFEFGSETYPETASRDSWLHSFIYHLNPEIRFIAHTHSPMAMVMSSCTTIDNSNIISDFVTNGYRPIDIFDVEGRYKLGPLQVLDIRNKRIVDLSAIKAIQNWGPNGAFLAKNHGPYIFGTAMEVVMDYLYTVESSCLHYYYTEIFDDIKTRINR